MNCKICNHTANPLFSTQVLLKYPVQYFKCTSCGFIQTEFEFWLNEAYSNAITSLDIGLIQRNEITKHIAKALIQYMYGGEGKYVDYGGGYGMFVRMMRDLGIDYYRQDIYCQNLFATYFDITDLAEDDRNKFNMLTAFEVFEHLQNPLIELEKMLQFSESIFFSTLLTPPNIASVKDWWYFIPETGQHIALYSKESLQYMANKYQLNLYSNNTNFHLFTKQKISSQTFNLLTNFYISKIYNIFRRRHKSLLQTDYKFINNTLNK